MGIWHLLDFIKREYFNVGLYKSGEGEGSHSSSKEMEMPSPWPMAEDLAKKPILRRWKHLIKGDFWGSGWDETAFMDERSWRVVALS